jgi:hypothetical protein
LQLQQIKSTPSEYALGLAKYLDDVKINVIKNLEKAHFKDKLRYDSKHKDMVYNINDKVLFYNPMIFPGRVNKLMRRFEGPYIVTKRCSPVLYQLDFKPTAFKSNIVHVSRLKPFYDRELMIKNFENENKTFIPKSVSKQFRSEAKVSDLSESKFSDSGSDSEQETDSIIDSNSDSESSSGSSTQLISDMYDHSNSNSLSENSTDSSISQLNEELCDDTPDPNYNTAQGLRRSLRTRKPPNKLNLYLATILCLTLFSDVSSLAIMEPLIWTKLNNPIIEGLETISTVISYESPCFLFNEPMIGNEATAELKDWCQKQFESDFIKPLNNFCTSVGPKDSVKFGLIREKRFIFLGAIALFTVISVVTSIGLGASSLTESLKAKSRLSTIEEESSIALKNIKELKRNAITEKKILQDFNVLLQNLTNEVFELKTDLHFVKTTAPKAIKAISILTTRLHHTKNVLLDIGRDFKRGKLNVKFLDLFNYTVSCGDKCPPQYWNAHNCYHDPLRNMILVRYTMKIVNTKLHVMAADTFDLVTRVVENGEKMLCHSEYVGPSAVIFDEVKRCVKPLKGNPRETTNLILVSNEIQCSDNEKVFSNGKYWRKGKCEQKDTIDTHDIVQIKNALSLNITIYNRDIKCPKEVFVLPSNQSFKIGDICYESQQMNLHTEIHFIPDWSYSINNQIDPHMRENVFSDYFSKLNMSISSLNTESLNYDFEKDVNYHKYGNIGLLLLISILFILIIVIFKRYELCSKTNRAVPGVKLSDLQTIELNEKPNEGNPTISSNVNKNTDSKVVLTLK